MDRAINAPGHGKNVVDGLNAKDKLYLKGKWNLLINEQITIPQKFGCFPVLQNMSPLNLHINVYI